jgi:autotransporter-associated beta strand protein
MAGSFISSCAVRRACGAVGLLSAGWIVAPARAVQIFGIDNLGQANAGTVGDRLIRFDSGNPLGTVINIGGTGFANEAMSGLEFTPSGTLYAASGFHTTGGPFPGSRLYTISPVTGQATLIGPMGLPVGTNVTDLSWNPATSQMLALANSGGGSNSLYTVNLLTGQATLIGTITGIPGTPIDIGLATNSAGTNFVHDVVSDRMYSLVGTNAAPLPQQIGADTNFSQGMTINWRGTNQWYLGAIGNVPAPFSDVRQINNATGATQAVLGTWPNNGAGGLPQYQLGDLAIMSAAPLSLTWNGPSPNNQWNHNLTNTNWLNGPASSGFAVADTANFGNVAVGIVQVDPGGVAPAAVNVSNTAGTYVFTGGAITGTGALTKTGAGVLILQNNNTFSGGVILGGGDLGVSTDSNLGAPTAALTFNGGALRIGGPGFNSTRAINIQGGGGVIDTGPSSAAMTGPITGPGALTKQGAGQLSLINIRSNGLNIANGEVHVLLGPAPSVPAGVSDVELLIIAGGPTAPTARIDLTNNAMIVGNTPADGGPDAETVVRGYISSGYAGGSWAGQGITSTSADLLGGEYGLGYADAGALGLGSFLGRTVQATDTVIRFTLYGDANVDGVVNLADFDRLAGNFGAVNATWRQGDFNYDFVVNLADFDRLAGNFGKSASPGGPTPADWAALASAIPEPSVAGLLAGTMAFLPRRRRA